MPREFKYVSIPSASYAKWEKPDILALNIPAEELQNYVIIRNESNYNKYYAYTKDEITSVKLGKKDSLHEIIFGQVPQKLKFDIDAYIDEDKVKPILTEIIGAICDQFHDNYMMYRGDFISADDIFIAESCGIVEKDGKEQYKASYHLLVAPHKYAVANNEEAAGFLSQVLLRLSEEAIKVIDYNVNKSVQNFRLLNSAKQGSDRVKKYKSGPLIKKDGKESKERAFLTSLISYCDGLTILPKKYAGNKLKFTPITEKVDVNDKMIERSLELAKDYTDGFEVRSVVNNMILFDRVSASFCRFCNETHHKDNTLVMFINKGDDDDDLKRLDQYGISIMCRHNGVMKQLGHVEPPNEEKDSLDKVLFNKAMKYKLTDNLDEIANKKIYDNAELCEYERCKTLFIKAPMKMGKTKKLREYIIKNYPKELNARIVVISFRRSFTDDFHAKYSDLGFINYSEVDGAITQSRIIIQAESLHRLHITIDPIDLLILDESESIIEQIDSGLFSNFAKSFAAFQWLIKTSEQVICMDALLGDRTYNVIKELRGTDDLILHHNKYKNATEDTYKMTINFGKWINELYKSLEKGEKIAIDSNCLRDAEVIKEFILCKFPKLKIGMYSSKTYSSVKKEHLSNVNHYWKQFDVLVKTPTVSAGVSFEEMHFDKVFGFFIGMTCTTQTCIQMMGRVRNVKSHEYVIYIKPNGALNLPVKRDIILTLLKMRHRIIMENIDLAQLSFSYKDNGEIEIYNSYYVAIWLENLINKNMNRNNFYGMLAHFVKTAGANVELLEGDADANEDLLNDCKSIKTQINDIELENIATAEDITPTKAQELYERKKNQDDISDQEYYQLEKYNIREHYGIEDTQKMTPEVVNTYKDRRIRNAYKNTVVFKDAIIGKREFADVLDDCRSNDSIHKGAISMRFELRVDSSRVDKNTKSVIQQNKNSIIDAFDVNHKYTYDKLKYMVWLLECCGWASPFDSKAIDEKTLIDNILSHKTKLNSVETINMLSMMFDMNWQMITDDREKTLKKFRKNINKVLMDTFDISIVKTPKGKYDVLNYYKLKKSSNFIVTEGAVDIVYA